MYPGLLAGNRRFVATEFKQHLDYYKTIAAGQSPKVLWIGCSDSRVSEDVITGSKPGTIFVHRNVANIVSYNDVNIAAILQYAVTYLKIPDIVVCGHTKCGGLGAVLDGIEDNYIGDWLLIAQGAKEKTLRAAARLGLDREQQLALLTKENVKLQIKHLKHMSFIRRFRAQKGVPRIHGWVYSVETGRIKVVAEERDVKQAAAR